VGYNYKRGHMRYLITLKNKRSWTVEAESVGVYDTFVLFYNAENVGVLWINKDQIDTIATPIAKAVDNA